MLHHWVSTADILRVTCSFKTPGTTFSVIQYHTPEDHNPQLHDCNNLRTHNSVFISMTSVWPLTSPPSRGTTLEYCVSHTTELSLVMGCKLSRPKYVSQSLQMQHQSHEDKTGICGVDCQRFHWYTDTPISFWDSFMLDVFASSIPTRVMHKCGQGQRYIMSKQAGKMKYLQGTGFSPYGLSHWAAGFSLQDILKKCTTFILKDARSTRRMPKQGNSWKHICLVVRKVKERKAGQSNQGKVWAEPGVIVVTLRRAQTGCRVRK